MTDRSELNTLLCEVPRIADQVDGPHLMDVYRERARQLAVCPTVSPASSWSALTVTVGSERICLPLTDLAEVLPYTRCSRLPVAASELLGLVNVRDRICSVIDLAALLGLVVADDRPRGFVILVRHGEGEVGLRVDRVDGIELASTQAGSRDSSTAVFAPQYVKECTVNRTPILNLRALFSHRIFQSRNSAGATRP